METGLQLAGKKVVVIGMARSGVAAANVALRRGAVVSCVDRRPDAPVVPGTTPFYGDLDPAIEQPWLSADLVVVSPGVPASNPAVAAAVEKGVQVLGELAFAAALMPGVPLLAVSGTNGKSTTTTLLGQLLEQAGKRTFTGGNLGLPLSAAVDGDANGQPYELAAVEVSSYQLELPGELRPRAAVILNLSPDHLERHGTMEAYGATKCRLFAQMRAEDAQVIPAGDARLERLSRYLPGSRRFVGGLPGVLVRPDRLVFEQVPDPGELSLDGFSLPGPHNRQNLAAAAILANWYGVKREQMDVSRLRGLPHRMELVATLRGVRWINDSKATNVDSVVTALQALDAPAVVLLGGKGKDKAPYPLLLDLLSRRSRAVVTFGEAGPEIAAVLRAGGLEVQEEATMAAAMERARTLAREGDIVLLSPACASFDAFTDFEHRGRVFARLLEEMA